MSQTQRDNLIGHVIDGEADDRQWDELQELAAADPTIWRDLADMQRQHQVMSLAMTEAAHIAERVEVRRWRPLIRIGTWSGWAVAALVVLAWMIRFSATTTPADPTTPAVDQTQVAGFSTLTDAIQAYLNDNGSPENGQVIKELPTKLLVNSRPLPEGAGYELVYVRQVLERTVVGDLFEFDGQDERGQSRLTRVRRRHGGAM